MRPPPPPRRPPHRGGRPFADWTHQDAPSWLQEGEPAPWGRMDMPPFWMRERRQHRRWLFLRFVGAFGMMVLLVVGGMGLLAWLLSRWAGGGQQVAALVWVSGCGLALALPLLALMLAARAFRGIATPLADVMDAANAVAEGDFSVRVAERGTPEFRRLAGSFNRMAAELQRSDQNRRNLMADVAHELRTPLHIIKGNLEGVLDGVYQPTPQHIDATLEETRLLARLVEDLRTLSLAEAGHLPMHWETVDVAELLQDVATSFSGQAEAAGVALIVEPAKDTGLTITADPIRLDQVVGNLVANALRHTPGGGQVTLAAGAVDGGVRITVADTGHGIPAEELPHIFDRFWSRASGGAGGGGGLGLAIARSIVEAHRGRIAVASQPDQGTTFTIELPASQPG